jgi:hypothetical protein
MTNDESRLRLADYLSHMLEVVRVKSSLPELERQLLPLVSQPTS